jgi:hypothetical protein
MKPDFPYDSYLVLIICLIRTDKNETKFSSYIGKFRWDRVQSYEEGLPNIGGNAQILSPYMRRSLVIYEFAPTPSEFPNTYMRKIFFSFLSVRMLIVSFFGDLN